MKDAKHKRKESAVIRLLYKTPVGRAVLKCFVNPAFSQKAGAFLSTYFSTILISFFIKKNHIDMAPYEKKKYCSFNDFFTRKRVSDKIESGAEDFISPCDGRLSVYPIDEEQSYRIKNIDYSTEELLRDERLACKFAGGCCMIFRLTPADYHRYCYVCDGTQLYCRAVDGVLNCVRPVAYDSVPVFIENSRRYSVIHSDTYGYVIQMEVGALLVGKITNHNKENCINVVKGSEKGYFEFGGSTIIVLVEKEKLKLLKHITENTKEGREYKVHMGEIIGHWDLQGSEGNNVKGTGSDSRR